MKYLTDSIRKRLLNGRGTGQNVIPPMTHPLSRHWKQPDTSAIVIDNLTARMSRATLDALPEYSCSIPTGAYEGKMWKREQYRPGQPILDPVNGKETGYFQPVPAGWLLCWYKSDENPEKVAVELRRIVVED